MYILHFVPRAEDNEIAFFFFEKRFFIGFAQGAKEASVIEGGFQLGSPSCS